MARTLSFLIFFTIMNIPLFNLHFDLFSIIAKEVNQIRKNEVCVVAGLIFVFFVHSLCFSLCCKCFSTYFRKLNKSEFYGPYFQTVLFLANMLWPLTLHFCFIKTASQGHRYNKILMFSQSKDGDDVWYMLLIMQRTSNNSMIYRWIYQYIIL